ncbi:hypothetical protein MCC_01065 [Rickettsia rhipicephali str. 3-7-female6-CWPP]|uniref:Ubiquitin-like protease family profile domain-containing protein n=1 Tax=Rickettsia rhipicephali (strain 3-7-female6-CWPP) TaxID=1105113 RepID=A0AAI8F623_RICR3|nr:hypothetical protein [Rickettsia rhipicephali]AFC71874.1 hypothetical protein MCC_01065 [Rickettsia rhipicephali str. 3-7-female6-CWPP]
MHLERVHEDLKNKGKVVLMPINTGHGHWVIMMISKDNNVNSNEVERPPYDNNDEVEVGGATMQLND